VRSGGEWEFPQNRCVHFMGVVGTALVGYLQGALGKTALWVTPLATLRPMLEGALQVCALPGVCALRADARVGGSSLPQRDLRTQTPGACRFRLPVLMLRRQRCWCTR
jgi:hypothetical protein